MGLPIAILGAALLISMSATAQDSADVKPDDAANASSAKACAEEVAAAMQRRYKGVRDLAARFVQTSRAVSFGGAPSEPLVSTGHMVLAKPGKMRWSYEEPTENLLISDGESIWTFDPAFGEAQRLPVAQGFLTGAASQFLLGEGDMQRDFLVTAVSCEPGSAEIELVPRKPASYERLFLVASPTTGDIRRSKVVDLLGNVTTIEFSELQVNRDPAPEVFRFVPPEGVKVIEIQP